MLASHSTPPFLAAQEAILDPPPFPISHGQHRYRGPAQGPAGGRTDPEDEAGVHTRPGVQVGPDDRAPPPRRDECCQILCALMLDTKGPEIRTGFLVDGKPVQLREGEEITISTDYNLKGDGKTITMSYKKLPVDMKPGAVAAGSLSCLELLITPLHIAADIGRKEIINCNSSTNHRPLPSHSTSPPHPQHNAPSIALSCIATPSLHDDNMASELRQSPASSHRSPPGLFQQPPPPQIHCCPAITGPPPMLHRRLPTPSAAASAAPRLFAYLPQYYNIQVGDAKEYGPLHDHHLL